MKTRNKLYDKSRLRLLCLLTALLGIFGAGQTWAGNPTTLTVGGTNALNGGYWWTNADGTLTPDGASADNYNVYYDGSGTLTLKDANITGDSSANFGAGIYAEGDLTIVLEGSSTVTGVVCNDESRGITTLLDGNLTIQGGGSLTARGADMSGDSSYGIDVDGSFTQQGGSVTAIAGNVSGSNPSSGLNVSGTVTVKGGTLTATGGSAAINSSYGISAYSSSVTVSDATVTATSGSAGYASYGLYIESSSPSVTLSGSSSLTARSGSATDTAGGICFKSYNSTGYVTVGDNSTLLANSVILRASSDEKPLAPTGDGSWLIYGQSNQPSAVGGNYTLKENITIPSDAKVTIPEGSTLTIPEDKTLTVDANQLVVNGELVLEGTFENAKELEGSGNLVLGEITLTDDEGISEYAGYHLKLKSKKVTYTRALSDNSQYGTICLPFVPTSVAGGQVTYYQVLELGSNVITLVETDFEAGKPLFYRTSGIGSITFSAESAAGVELVTIPATDSFMVGTMSVDTPTAGYFLKNGNIYPIANGEKVKVKPFRAYVKGQNDASQASVMSVNVARP